MINKMQTVSMKRNKNRWQNELTHWGQTDADTLPAGAFWVKASVPNAICQFGQLNVRRTASKFCIITASQSLKYVWLTASVHKVTVIGKMSLRILSLWLLYMCLFWLTACSTSKDCDNYNVCKPNGTSAVTCSCLDGFHEVANFGCVGT